LAGGRASVGYLRQLVATRSATHLLAGFPENTKLPKGIEKW